MQNRVPFRPAAPRYFVPASARSLRYCVCVPACRSGAEEVTRGTLDSTVTWFLFFGKCWPFEGVKGWDVKLSWRSRAVRGHAHIFSRKLVVNRWGVSSGLGFSWLRLSPIAHCEHGIEEAILESSWHLLESCCFRYVRNLGYILTFRLALAVTRWSSFVLLWDLYADSWIGRRCSRN